MTDARFPERWLNDRRVMRLSDGAFKLFVCSLAWSVGNRTDGVIEQADVELIPGYQPHNADELSVSGLWQLGDSDRYEITVYEDTQTSRAQLEAADRKRAGDRERQARHRLAQRDQSRDVTRDVTRENKGQDRPVTGQASVPATQLERTTQLEEEQDAHAHAREDCAADGCTRSPRHGCWTCVEHAREEFALRRAAS